MKTKILLILISSVLSFQTVSAQETFRLFGNKTEKSNKKEKNSRNYQNNNEIMTLTGKGSHTGFYFGFNAGYLQIDGHDALSVGASLAMIANHGLALGLAGKGYVSEFFPNGADPARDYNYAGGYGGLLIEPIVLPKYPVHLSFPIILGVGGHSYNRITYHNHPYYYDDFRVERAGVFLIAEPGMEMELNITRWMRLGVGGSYRITASIDSGRADKKELNGFTAGFSAKFGIF